MNRKEPKRHDGSALIEGELTREIIAAFLLHFGPTPKHHRFVVTKSIGQR